MELLKDADSRINGMEAIRIAFAGVGRPIKFSVWRVSTLNLASLSIENTGEQKCGKVQERAYPVYLRSL